MTTIQAFDVPPNSTDFNGGPAVFGNDFKANAPGILTGVWYFHELDNEPSSVSALVHRQSNQQLLSQKTLSTAGLTENAYNLIALDDTVAYPTPDELLTISVYWPLGGFSFSTGVGERSSDGLSINVGSIGRFKNSAVSLGDYPGPGTIVNLACPVGAEFTFTGSAPSVEGSWYQLLSVMKERQEIVRQNQATPPQACPNDGEPLQRKGGILHCPFDGWQWPRDGDGIK